MQELQSAVAGLRLASGAARVTIKLGTSLIPLFLLYVVALAPGIIWVRYYPSAAVNGNPALSWPLMLAAVHPHEWLLKTVLIAWNGLLLALWIAVVVWRRRGGIGAGRARSASHGSARWGTGRALRQPAGRIVGRMRGRLLRYNGPGHLVTIAPTRSGKGVSAVIPNLLDHPGSVVVTDIKGENYAVTAMRRARDLGHQVHALDPFGVADGRACYNPLDILDPANPHAYDDAVMLADMLCAPAEGAGKSVGGSDQHFEDGARALLAGLMLHVVQLPKTADRTLLHLRALLSGTAQELEQLWNTMLASGGPQATNIRRAAAGVLQKADKERSAVISTAQRHTAFLDSAAMTLTLAHSSLNLADLNRDRLSLYLVLPPEYLDTHHRWLRLMVACTLRAVTNGGARGQRPAERVLFVLDEFANLGPMAPLVRAVSLLTGYGLTLWLFVQDLAKLRAVYRDTWGTFLANADVLQVFGTNDMFTAEYLSKMTGQSTVAVRSSNWSEGESQQAMHIIGSHSTNDGGNVAPSGRPLLFPDEVRRLPLSQQLLFVKGSDALRTNRVSYLDDAEFAGMYARNPFHLAPTVNAVPARAWRGALRTVASRFGFAA